MLGITVHDWSLASPRWCASLRLNVLTTVRFGTEHGMAVLSVRERDVLRPFPGGSGDGGEEYHFDGAPEPSAEPSSSSRSAGKHRPVPHFNPPTSEHQHILSGKLLQHLID